MLENDSWYLYNKKIKGNKIFYFSNDGKEWNLNWKKKNY